MFRIIAGGYLIYLGIRLIREGLLTGQMQGGARVLGVVASAAFIVVGAVVAFKALTGMANRSDEAEEEQQEVTAEAEEQPAEDTAPAAPSLFDRAGFGAASYDEDEDEEADGEEADAEEADAEETDV